MGLHELHHMKRNFQLWHMNNTASSRIIRKVNSEQFGEFTLTSGSAKHLKSIEALHLRLFGEPMLSWLVWLYRFKSSKLLSVALDNKGNVVGYECFMFNEVEINDAILHEVYVGVDPSIQGKGVATALRRFSIKSYNFGSLRGLSTVALQNDIKALRSAQKAGYAITKHSLKPPGQYMFHPLSLHR